ncbi:MAG: hypothetical protein HOV81_25615 [Kofleriaceae bacterium]|nr:hypothetical protein [Kofleriaceae bacterium]
MMTHPPQEPDVVPVRNVSAIGLGVIVAIAACCLAATGIASCGTRGRSPYRAAAGPEIPQDVSEMETRPFTVEAQGLEANQRAEQLLSQYSWIDRDKGTVRVPVEVAYQLLLQKQHGGTK